MSEIYSMGVDPGLKGAISFINLEIERSSVLPLPYRPWQRYAKNNEKCFDKKGKRKRVANDCWGSQLVDIDTLIEEAWTLGSQDRVPSFYPCRAYLEDPGKIGNKSFTGNLSVGANISLLNEACRRLTTKDSERVTPKEWQSHPAIRTLGAYEWGKGKGHQEAKNKKEAKKFESISVANRIFGIELDYDLQGSDGFADALLIGLYGALLYPPVVSLSPTLAWFCLEHERASFLPIPSNLPFSSALVYARRYEKEENLRDSRLLVEAFDVVPPRPETLKREGGIIGYVTLDGKPKSKGVDWNEYAHKITSRRVYPQSIPFDMDGVSVAQYVNQLPHLI